MVETFGIAGIGEVDEVDEVIKLFLSN